MFAWGAPFVLTVATMNCRRIFGPFSPRQFIGDLTFGGKLYGRTRTWFGGNRRVSPVFLAVAQMQSSAQYNGRLPGPLLGLNFVGFAALEQVGKHAAPSFAPFSRR